MFHGSFNSNGTQFGCRYSGEASSERPHGGPDSTDDDNFLSRKKSDRKVIQCTANRINALINSIYSHLEMVVWCRSCSGIFVPATVDLNIIHYIYTFLRCESQTVRLMKCKAVYLNSKQCKRPAASCALTFVKKHESKFVYKPEFILFKLTNRLHRCVRVL